MHYRMHELQQAERQRELERELKELQLAREARKGRQSRLRVVWAHMQGLLRRGKPRYADKQGPVAP